MAGKDAFGTQFRRDSDGAGLYQTIANCTNISGPGRTREPIDVTAHDSFDQYMEFVKGLKDPGEVTLSLNYDPEEGSHEALDGDYDEKDNRNYQIVILPGEPEEHTWEFEGLITDLGDEFPYDNRMEREVTVKISGKPVLTATGV